MKFIIVNIMFISIKGFVLILDITDFENIFICDLSQNLHLIIYQGHRCKLC